MSATKLANAISMIDDSILSDVLEERYRRNAGIKEASKSFKTIGRLSLVAAAIAAVCLLAIFTVSNNPVPQDTNSILDTPQYIAAFRSPELKALYEEYPYSRLLPQKVPEKLSFISSYKTEYDPTANPENYEYLALCFGGSIDTGNLEIKVTKYDGKKEIADPAKPETYDISLYYEYLETPGAVGANAPKIFRLIRAEDLSLSIAEKRMYVFDDGLCKAQIEVLCGEYVVAYSYAGPELTSDLFYEVITSPDYFTKESTRNNDNRTVSQNIPNYIPAYSTPSMEQLYMTHPFDVLLPKEILPSCTFQSSYKIEPDVFANPDSKTYLSVLFNTSMPNCNLEISISDQPETLILADIANPQTYNLKCYYEGRSSDLVDGIIMEDNQFFSVFKSEDISPQLMDYRTHTFEDGLCKANIAILCDSYIISYNYTGPVITTASLYKMITSAKWFR
ncbi:MAG: hypothetical protein E7461_07965 [Ruminococcaceae bacterium]|nr:hypothetical protein [Oscillospiraceae bacterium]